MNLEMVHCLSEGLKLVSVVFVFEIDNLYFEMMMKMEVIETC